MPDKPNQPINTGDPNNPNPQPRPQPQPAFKPDPKWDAAYDEWLKAQGIIRRAEWERDRK
jgi:hypothetical protein